jgi:hypothetical protein
MPANATLRMNSLRDRIGFIVYFPEKRYYSDTL